MNRKSELIPKHGGYRKLKGFQVAEVVYDVTVRFCDKYIDRKSRTHDQMVQAARSGVQNIVEGSEASATSKKIELKLTGTARASLEELHRDYEDFLRQRGLPIWEHFDPRRADLIARRPHSADAVAAWAKDVKHGRCGRDGQSCQSMKSISYCRDRRQRCPGSHHRGVQPPRTPVGFPGAGLRARGRLHRTPLPHPLRTPPSIPSMMSIPRNPC